MTPKEALNILDETVIGNFELKVVLSKALEKQIPKKPIADISKDYEGNIIDDVFFCPKCTRTICFGIENNFAENYPYCNCGQALDWGDCE
jgi:hypothetical protein